MFRGDLKPFLYTKRLLCDTFSFKPLDTWRFAITFALWIRCESPTKRGITERKSRTESNSTEEVVMKKDDLSFLKELLEGQLDYLQNQADHTVI